MTEKDTQANLQTTGNNSQGENKVSKDSNVRYINEETVYFQRAFSRTKDFTIVPNDIINADLSPEAFKILCTLISRGDNWKPIKSHLQKLIGCGEKKTRRVLKELTDAGYMKLTRNMANGKFYGSTYSFADAPIFLEAAEMLASSRGGTFCRADDSTGAAVLGASENDRPIIKNNIYIKNNNTNNNNIDLSNGESDETLEENVVVVSDDNYLSEEELTLLKEWKVCSNTVAEWRNKYGADRLKEVIHETKNNKATVKAGFMRSALEQGWEFTSKPVESKPEARSEEITPEVTQRYYQPKNLLEEAQNKKKGNHQKAANLDADGWARLAVYAMKKHEPLRFHIEKAGLLGNYHGMRADEVIRGWVEEFIDCFIR